MKNLFSVENKVVVMTGACGVLGATIVKHFAEQGSKVVFSTWALPERLARALLRKSKPTARRQFVSTDGANKEALEVNYRR